MDQIGVNTMRSLQKLIKSAMKTRVLTAFPNLPQNSFEIQLESISNNLNFEYKTPTVIRIFNQFKKQNLFGDLKTEVEVAQKIASTECQDNIIQKIEAIDKGFLTIQLNDKFIEDEINALLMNGLKFPLEKKQKVVVDFSSPNIAKEMHVGHLRSTIIGESLCRILEFQGQEVVRVNHIGDWGTQFGMLINHLLEEYPDYQTNRPALKELEDLYKEAKKKFDSNEEFKVKSQQYVVKLQALDPVCIDAWKMICELSRQEYNKIYQRLNVKITEYGESYYNPILPEIVKECEAKGIVELDQGAKIIRVKGEKVPLMIVKKDGGYNYDTTDMAAAKTRILEWKCDRLLYLTDVGQWNHFKLIFEGAKLMGWHQPPITSMEHMGFGLVLGPDGKKFKTRSGDTVKLIDLLDEAKERALKQIIQRVQESQQGKEFSTGTALSPEEFDTAAERMGIAAIKYYDLKQNRISDYNFDYDKMLDPKGNTAVYLMYSYVRMLSILRKSGIQDFEIYRADNKFKITHPHERHLAAQLLRFVDVLQSVTDQLAINWLCDYIYDICVKIAEAYNQYRILNDEHTQTRLLLCEAIRMVLLQSFYLVGIEPIEKI
ncbi:unnamed protein product [Paramecium pentaurelia]|uniref:arginine--tRNA ligase n=1 Tax=Paramecium pentaurelia TaxID=43138 RepID=A0A8S1X9Y6_9CILI|nr:unnamed protein product [Paramecium pentaurelia]